MRRKHSEGETKSQRGWDRNTERVGQNHSEGETETQRVAKGGETETQCCVVVLRFRGLGSFFGHGFTGSVRQIGS